MNEIHSYSPSNFHQCDSVSLNINLELTMGMDYLTKWNYNVRVTKTVWLSHQSDCFTPWYLMDFTSIGNYLSRYYLFLIHTVTKTVWLSQQSDCFTPWYLMDFTSIGNYLSRYYLFLIHTAAFMSCFCLFKSINLLGVLEMQFSLRNLP